jgi:hypothetical protein
VHGFVFEREPDLSLVKTVIDKYATWSSCQKNHSIPWIMAFLKGSIVKRHNEMRWRHETHEWRSCEHVAEMSRDTRSLTNSSRVAGNIVLTKHVHHRNDRSW